MPDLEPQAALERMQHRQSCPGSWVRPNGFIRSSLLEGLVLELLFVLLFGMARGLQAILDA